MLIVVDYCGAWIWLLWKFFQPFLSRVWNPDHDSDLNSLDGVATDMDIVLFPPWLTPAKRRRQFSGMTELLIISLDQIAIIWMKTKGWLAEMIVVVNESGVGLWPLLQLLWTIRTVGIYHMRTISEKNRRKKTFHESFCVSQWWTQDIDEMGDGRWEMMTTTMMMMYLPN